jgi:hypothetical protein
MFPLPSSPTTARTGSSEYIHTRSCMHAPALLAGHLPRYRSHLPLPFTRHKTMVLRVPVLMDVISPSVIPCRPSAPHTLVCNVCIRILSFPRSRAYGILCLHPHTLPQHMRHHVQRKAPSSVPRTCHMYAYMWTCTLTAAAGSSCPMRSYPRPFPSSTSVHYPLRT